MEQSKIDEFDASLLQQELAAPDQEKDFRLAQWQLDLQEMLDMLVHHWHGDTYDPLSNDWKHDPEQRMMSDAGLRNIISHLSIANRNIFLSNFTDEEIRDNMKYFMISFTNYLAMNFKKFEIDKHNLTMIKEQVKNIMFAAFKRAQLAGERKSIYQTQKVIESTTTHPEAPKTTGGLFGLFKRK